MLAKFMNVIMKSGKKSVAERILYGALDRISEKTGRKDGEAIEVLSQALDNVKSNRADISSLRTVESEEESPPDAWFWQDQLPEYFPQ